MLYKDTIQSGWGRALRSKARIARPERRAALDELMSTAPAPAFGAARSYGDAALNADGALIDMSRLNRLLRFTPETGRVRAEAGVTLGELLAIFGPQGWMPAAMPGTAHVTLGGAIASDVHGKNHHAHGSFGQHVSSIRLLGADGKLRDISEVEHPELFRATIGGMGHALPYLIPDFRTATTIAIAVVFVELWAIAWIQNRYMETPFLRAALQVVLGGALVFAAGVLIGGG